MNAIEERLAQLEHRFDRIEQIVISMSGKETRSEASESVAPEAILPAAMAPQVSPASISAPTISPIRPQSRLRETQQLPVTQILGWTGATLVLAMVLQVSPFIMAVP